MTSSVSDLLTTQRIKKISPSARDDIIESILTAAGADLEAAGIDSAIKLSHLIGQFAAETLGLSRLDENLRYTTLGALQNAFGAKRFPNQAAAVPFLKNPEGLANFVYAGRNGNGNQASGDGFRYRGSGLIQLTGRKNFREAEDFSGLELENEPELARSPDSALRIALAYWVRHDINSVATAAADAVSKVTRKINPSLAGLEDREIFCKRARNVFLAAEKGEALVAVAVTAAGLMAPAAPAARALSSLSGPHWVAKFPTSRAISDLSPPFDSQVADFVGALRAAGANVRVSATLRPKQRAWLMHWAWKIAKRMVDPADVPEMSGVGIDWTHPTLERSRRAAREMVAAYGMVNIAALNSRHIEGRAIDMTTSWSGRLDIRERSGSVRSITTAPRNGSNRDLRSVGRSYGVIKLPTDPPHWSDDGR